MNIAIPIPLWALFVLVLLLVAGQWAGALQARNLRQLFEWYLDARGREPTEDRIDDTLAVARQENEALRDAHRALWDATSEIIGLELDECVTGWCRHDHQKHCPDAIRRAIAQVAKVANDARARAAITFAQE